MNHVIIEPNLDKLLLPERRSYREFIYCTEGQCVIACNERRHTLTAKNCAILVTRFIQSVECSEDFKCEVIYIDANFLRQSEPNDPVIIQTTLQLSMNPIIEVEEKDYELVRQLFFNFKLRLYANDHKFYDEILRTSARMLVLDLFNIYRHSRKGDNMSRSSAEIMQRFFSMLQDKEYRENREVAYYAEKLGVVPKYLSEISNKTSGFSASYWINRFTSFDINQILHEKKISSNEIARLFHFTSTSYFNRYVKRYLGAYPNELRGQ